MLYRSVVAGLLLFTSPAFGSELEPWGEAGGWDILIDPTTGNGCLMEKTFEGETLVQIGTVPDRQGGFLGVYNPAWGDIEDGTEGVVRIDFGDALFEGAVRGKILNGIPGGYAFFDNPDFVGEFAKRNSLTVTGKKSGHSAEISLKGTTKALAAVRSCQKQQPKS